MGQHFFHCNNGHPVIIIVEKEIADIRSCTKRYYSNIILDGKSLNCAWIDCNGDVPYTAFQTHIHEFAEVPANHGKGVS